MDFDNTKGFHYKDGLCTRCKQMKRVSAPHPGAPFWFCSDCTQRAFRKGLAYLGLVVLVTLGLAVWKVYF